MTTKGAAWSTLRKREAKLTTVGKTARIQETSREACDEELDGAGHGMPVLMRGRMHLARKPIPIAIQTSRRTIICRACGRQVAPQYPSQSERARPLLS